MDWEQFIAVLQGRVFFFFFFFNLFDKDKLGSQSSGEKCDHSYAKHGEITLITLELGLLVDSPYLCR